jgi:hypothetical protein
MKQVTLDAMAVDPGAVTAVQVFENVLLVLLNDPGVAAGGAVIAKDKVIVGLAADQERKFVEVDPGALARGVEHKESGAVVIRLRKFAVR